MLNTPALEILARFGYGARGVVYCLIGGLASLAALGAGGQTGGSESALRTLIDQPFGRILLGIIALGLFSFAAWRLVEAITDADRHGNSAKALAVRGAHVVSGFIYAGLALTAVGLAFGRRGGGAEDQASRDWTAWLMAMPLGNWLVAAVGIVIAGVGFAFLRRSWRGDVTRHLALPEEARQWIRSMAAWAMPAAASCSC